MARQAVLSRELMATKPPITAPDNDPLVSVVMAVQDNASTIVAAVRSIQAQTLQDWELVLIDDGSRDGSADLVQALGESRLRLISDDARRGLPVRLNQAVALARGQFIARMDADDMCFPERFTRQADYLRQHPQLDLIGCDALVFTDDKIVGLMQAGRDHAAITARPHSGFALPHPTWFGRAGWFHSNRYDERMVKAQDQDLLLRSYRGSCFGSVPEVLVAYRQDRLNLRKMLRGRALFAGALWRQARVCGDYAGAAKGIAAHGMKAGFDTVSMLAGLGDIAQRRRLVPVSPAVADEWTRLQAQLVQMKDAPCAA
jgi:glycosyltransferase involved in cell wall biosynthesis